MDNTFDFVIVGAGSAGCVLANRLSEHSANRVCLIEAGPPDDSPLIRVPLGITRLKRHKELNWCFNSIPQQGASGRRIFVPRGRALGGSSSINGMIYMRGHRLDYDEWSDAGNPGWSYREVLPYFIRSERNADFGPPYHGTEGPVHVTMLDMYSPLCEMMLEAARTMRWTVVDDFNGACQEGFGKRQVTTLNGRRVSSATAFLRPALRRQNLTVLTQALAERVTFAGRRATGVDILSDGQKLHLGARREVILAAGTIGSPLVLLRSGIGDGNEVQRFDIPLVHHLPAVGENLQDHFMSAICHETASPIPYGLSARTLPWWAYQIVRYVLTGKGILANNIVNSGGYVRSSNALSRPDLGFTLMPAKRSERTQFAVGHGYGMVVYPLRPSVRGKVSLTHPGPGAQPMIDYRLFLGDAGARDMELLLKGLKLARKLLSASPWESVRGPEVMPGPEVVDDSALIEYVRKTCITAYHPVGTCKMGSGPADTVVDPELRVHGIDGLRVVDASIMPRLVGGNTHAPTVMIAEKGSDMVLGKRPPTPITDL